MSDDHGHHDYPEVYEGDFEFTNGKLGMWLFLVSDAMAFIGFLGAYMVLRMGAPTGELADRGELLPWQPAWGPPLEVILTGLNTFVLIISSVTMVKAFSAIQDGDQKKLRRFLLYTMAGGTFFVGFQCYEWTHMIHLGGTTQGMVVPGLDEAMTRAKKSGLDTTRLEMARQLFGMREGAAELEEGFTQDEYLDLEYVVDDYENPIQAGVIGLPEYGIPQMDRWEQPQVSGEELMEMSHDDRVAAGARVPSNFTASFFVLTGFHGLHVLIGVFYLGIIWFLAGRGRFTPSNCSAVEIVGLYWHFVDLVWVLLFMLIYLL